MFQQGLFHFPAVPRDHQRILKFPEDTLDPRTQHRKMEKRIPQHGPGAALAGKTLCSSRGFSNQRILDIPRGYSRCPRQSTGKWKNVFLSMGPELPLAGKPLCSSRGFSTFPRAGPYMRKRPASYLILRKLPSGWPEAPRLHQHRHVDCNLPRPGRQNG